jgi:hypothetical protein
MRAAQNKMALLAANIKLSLPPLKASTSTKFKSPDEMNILLLLSIFQSIWASPILKRSTRDLISWNRYTNTLNRHNKFLPKNKDEKKFGRKNDKKRSAKSDDDRIEYFMAVYQHALFKKR